MVALRRRRYLHPRGRDGAAADRVTKFGIGFRPGCWRLRGAARSALCLLWQRRNSHADALRAPQNRRVADAVAVKSDLLLFWTAPVSRARAFECFDLSGRDARGPEEHETALLFSSRRPTAGNVTVGVLGKPGMAERMFAALEPGSNVSVDLSDKWDYWPYAGLPIDEARQRLNVVAVGRGQGRPANQAVSWERKGAPGVSLQLECVSFGASVWANTHRS
jgi:hypothetical protein